MTFLLTLLSLLGFSANSLLTRPALRDGSIDAAGFTAVRIISGAVTLIVLATISGKKPFKKREPVSALMLFAYAILFSFAYLSLNAATGALIAFAAVQITMMTGGFLKGERHGAAHWVGFVIAVGGLVYLLLPGLGAPPLGAALLMYGAGSAWGIYSLIGKGETDPIGRTAWNFVLAVPMALAVVMINRPALHLTAHGATFAILSGAVSSAFDYTIWYAVLKRITASRAALVQLSVPVITAALAVAFLGETATLRLFVSGALVLSGIAVAIFVPGKAPR